MWVFSMLFQCSCVLVLINCKRARTQALQIILHQLWGCIYVTVIVFVCAVCFYLPASTTTKTAPLLWLFIFTPMFLFFQRATLVLFSFLPSTIFLFIIFFLYLDGSASSSACLLLITLKAIFVAYQMCKCVKPFTRVPVVRAKIYFPFYSACLRFLNSSYFRSFAVFCLLPFLIYFSLSITIALLLLLLLVVAGSFYFASLFSHLHEAGISAVWVFDKV